MLRFTMCPQEARKCNSGGETDPQINRIETLEIDLHKYNQLIFEVQRWMKESFNKQCWSSCTSRGKKMNYNQNLTLYTIINKNGSWT